MKKTFKTVWICLLFITILTFHAKADVKLPAIFGDNMVLQQQSQVAIWGWAQPNATVKVTNSWDKKSYSAKSDANGYWKLKVQTPAASFTPYTLTISDNKTITLKNILIGEVWVCSGQSNMEMPVKGFSDQQPIDGGPEAILRSTNPGIRLFTVQRAAKLDPQTDCVGSWQQASLESVPDFSATAYFFGRLLNEVLDIPIGLIHTSWGGSRIEAWMNPSSLKDFPEKIIPAPNSEIRSPTSTPTVLYNGMINPIIGFGMRGVIWYQGESNKDEPNLYINMFTNMLQDWRNSWGIGEFPFYYCQIAPYNYGGLSSAWFRDAQSKCMAIPNTGMAVLMDSDSPNGIHPPKKKDAGERLALWALAKTYGMEKVMYKSPEVKKVDISGSVVTLTFDVPNSGITAYGKEILGFQIAGANKRFYPAKAAIVSTDKVYVFSPMVPEPVAVRYCFTDAASAELFSIGNRLPVSSFRTDDWDIPTSGR